MTRLRCLECQDGRQVGGWRSRRSVTETPLGGIMSVRSAGRA
jgi:hypothetical protein